MFRSSSAATHGLVSALHANLTHKVVTMLQDMQKSVEQEGEKEKELFEKFMCYCNNGAGALDSAIETGKSQIEQLTSQIEKETALKLQLEQDVAQNFQTEKRTRDYDSCIISYVLLHVLCHGLSMLPPYNYFCVCVMPISCRPKSCDLRKCGTWILTCGNWYVLVPCASDVERYML